MNHSAFSVSIDQRYFEDYIPGSIQVFGTAVVAENEIVEFARRYDPQEFHIDPVAAKQTAFGGLIASGWHTAAMMMRLLVDNYLSSVASLGSPGVDELRWTKPVRPGDTLSVRVTVLDATRSRSKPDRGIIKSSVEVLNQNDEIVMTMRGVNLMLCREKAL